MKNPIFKAQLETLFSKVAWGQDPHAVLQQIPHADSGDVRRGLALIEGIKGFGSAAQDVLDKGYQGASRFLDPAGDGGGQLARGISRVGEYFAQRPALARTAVGVAALAPILGYGFSTSRKQHEDELMKAYADPSRTIVASLDDFLEKKAELYPAFKEAAMSPGWGAPSLNMKDLQKHLKRFQAGAKKQHKRDVKDISRSVSKTVGKRMDKSESFWPSAGRAITEGVGKGIGSSLGGVVVGLVAHGVGTGVDALRDHFMVDPKRKALVETLLRTDPVLSDAVARHPDSLIAIKEAYGTMVRFAPTLSLDINAVRSFLREAVLGGAGVNYATIKNLVETERSISDAKPNYMFGGH